MYFEKRRDTNIDSEFKSNSNILDKLKKYKIYILIAIILIILIILMILMFVNKEPTNYLYLNGEETITLYQGSDYIEPGYQAYNSKEEDLTSKVVINSNLNTKEIGEYEISYTLGTITEIRNINIIAKPQEYTYIYLKTVNNSVNVFVKINDKYQEPGYQVFSSTGTDLTSKVKVTGTVDTSKKGSYKLVYSVVDSNNVTISNTRTVIVMDFEINLLLDTEEYTNKDVIINVGIIDEYFDYMILPNNTKIKSSIYSYKVTKNGKYTFTTYNTRGVSKQKTIEVTNIDKTSPTGNCTGYYKDGTSVINVNATDNIKVNKYVISNVSYNTNKITLNKELKTVNITIYDIAGNTKNISCSLENKNSTPSTPTPDPSPSNPTPTPEPPSNPLDDIYTSSNSHTNSINGVKYLLYNQTDSRWGSVQYPSGITIGENGCMITSVAVVSSSYDHTITPKTVFDTYRHNYPYDGINKLVDDGFNCQFVSASNSKSKILTALSEGKPVVIMVYGSKKGGSSAFTSSQHYMALLDYKNNKIFVGNSYSTSGHGKSGWYNADEVLTSVQEVNICTPTQKLIDRFK